MRRFCHDWCPDYRVPGVYEAGILGAALVAVFAGAIANALAGVGQEVL